MNSPKLGVTAHRTLPASAATMTSTITFFLPILSPSLAISGVRQAAVRTTMVAPHATCVVRKCAAISGVAG